MHPNHHQFAELDAHNSPMAGATRAPLEAAGIQAGDGITRIVVKNNAFILNLLAFKMITTDVAVA